MRQTREEIEQLRAQQPEIECAFCYRKLPRIARTIAANGGVVYQPAQRPHAPFCSLRCALDFARAAHMAGYRVAGKGETEVRS